MALFLIVFTLLLSSIAPSTFSLTPPTTTTLLDVSSSLQRTKSILSFDPHFFSTQEEETPLTVFNSTPPPTFSIELRSRETLYKTHHKSYKSLLHSRLSRDVARVKSLLSRLSLALSGTSISTLKPIDSSSQIFPEGLSTPVSSGTSQGSGEYFSRVGIGNPSKPYYLVLDTGSDVSWLQCKPCTDCYSQTDPVFDPTTSSSLSPLTCDSRECTSLEMSSCRSGRCLYQVNYGDGSFTFGDFVTETVSFGNSGAVNHIALGCGHDNEGLFVGSAGLLGLGGGPLSLTSQIKATSFSYCLVNRDSPSSSTLEFNAGSLGDSAVIAPLMRSSKIHTFYYVDLTGISVGGQPVSIPSWVFQLDESGNGGVIVDCGTAITRLQTQAYDSLRGAFVGMTTHLKSTSGVALFDTCYDLSGLSSVRVPTLAFHFPGGRSWNLPAENYLIPVDSQGTYCLAFAPTTSSLSIIGNVQQQGTRVSFDLANNRVGFATNQC